MVEKVSVMEKDWDHLIILDACRYDFFSRLYPSYLRGELKKVISLGSSTIEWCKKSFKERYNDVVYISTNPFINSKLELLNFDAKNHFHEIIDVWDWGWNEELGTVHPKTVNEAVHKLKDVYPDKRFIIHYLQPHEPYLGHNLGNSGFPRPKLSRGSILVGVQNSQHNGGKITTRILERCLEVTSFNAILSKSHILRGISKILAIQQNLYGNPLWKLRELLKLPAASPIDAVRRKFGNDGLRKAYAENLRFVLKYVAKLVENLSGVIIITSDHGERLGEGNTYAHFSGLSDPLLIEVPWFKVEKAVK